MNLTTLLDNLHQRGIRFRVDGERLRWFAPLGAMTESDISALKRHKAEAIEVLRDAEQDAYEERAAIIQFDTYFSRRAAERRSRNRQSELTGGDAA